jgi:drug/metabolite transporter (DMT)-like permease
MLFSSVLLSFFSLFGKFATQELPFFFLAFLRFSIPLVLMLPYLLWKCTFRELFAVGDFKLQLMRMVCAVVYQYSIFYYLMHSTLLNATVIQNTFPLFLPILEKIFYKHRFNKREIASIVICFVGVLCILQPDKEIWASLSVVAILAPLGQAGSQTLFAHQARLENQKSTLFYLYFLSSIVTAAVYLFSPEFLKESHPLNAHGFIVWVNVVMLGVVSLFNQILRGIAYRYGKPSALVPFLYVSLIASAFLDWVIFGHLPQPLSILGAILVIAGGLLPLYEKK